MRGGVECPQGFDLIAKPFCADGSVQVRGEHVQDPAPHRKLPFGFDQFDPFVAALGQEGDDGLPVAAIALPEAPRGTAKLIGRGNDPQQRRDRRDDPRRRTVQQPQEHCHPLTDDLRSRAFTVLPHVPLRKHHDTAL